MARNYEGLSELERELELDMEDTSEFDIDVSGEPESASGEDEWELQDESESGEESESDFEFEGSDDQELETSDFSERLFEIAQREFESPEMTAEAIDGVLNEMYERFFSLKKLKKGLGGIAKIGIAALSKHPALAALKNVFAGKNLTQALSGIAQMAAAGTPLGAALGPVIQSLGFPGGSQSQQREAWDNFVEVARESYADLAENMNEAAFHPLKANQVAQQSLRRGFQRTLQRIRNHRRRGNSMTAVEAAAGHRGKGIRIRVRPGQRRRIWLEIIGE